VEAVEYYLLPISAPFKISRFRVCFRFQLLSSMCVIPLPQKFNRFHHFRFHISAPCLMKNASAFGSSKSQMVPSLLPLPAFFFKVLPLPQKFNRFHRFGFQLPLLLPHSCFNYSTGRLS